MNVIKVTLPFPVSLNQMYVPSVNKKTGKAYTRVSDAAKAYKLHAQQELMIQTIGTQPLQGEELEVWLNYYYNRNKPDSDNILKILFDAMEKFVYEDDKQIKAHHVDMFGGG